MPQRIKLFLIITVAVVIFALIAIIFNNSVVSSPWKSAASQHSNFSIDYPPTWSQSEEQNLFYLVNTKSKGEFRQYITISYVNPFGSNTDSASTFEKIYQAPENSDVSGLFAKPELTQSSQTKIKNAQVAGHVATEVREQSIMPGPYFVRIIYVLKDNNVWAIRQTASIKEELDTQSQTFQQILSTFKFMPN